MYVAFDDTDSTESMCTTFLATEVVDAMREYDLIGLPRLVRLNPAVPWKTRGNGALSMRFGEGKGQATLVGMIRDQPIYCYPKMIKPAPTGKIMDRCSYLVEKWSRVQEGASPGLVVSPKRPSQGLYWKAVRDIVEKKEVTDELDRIGAKRFELAGGRGVIGSSAAMSWRPRDRTYEVIAYRERSRWGTPREISDDSVWKMDQRFKTTFNNFDETVGRRAISPHTNCPVLFGIRGDDPFVLPSAMHSVESEPVDRWLLYLSNQGTDDHVVHSWKELVPERSYDVVATVIEGPRTIKGGHVVIGTLTDMGSHLLDMTAYEPSKTFRDIIKQLAVGDRIRAYGEVRESPRTLNLEKLQVLAAVAKFEKVANPRCGQCGKSMQSMGSSGGYRCKKCGAKASEDAAEKRKVERAISVGWYEPPVCARRHLSKPLKREGAAVQRISL
ncbi:MAG: tRNA(Ile)(2)-agmatinylcytidine synthase [Euryarchaeota archaeon]|nr:tRNA(Ile)(2)-agmatinylcytidine synthase [Euryarchaeota archaeon]